MICFLSFTLSWTSLKGSFILNIRNTELYLPFFRNKLVFFWIRSRDRINKTSKQLLACDEVEIVLEVSNPGDKITSSLYQSYNKNSK